MFAHCVWLWRYYVLLRTRMRALPSFHVWAGWVMVCLVSTFCINLRFLRTLPVVIATFVALDIAG